MWVVKLVQSETRRTPSCLPRIVPKPPPSSKRTLSSLFSTGASIFETGGVGPVDTMGFGAFFFVALLSLDSAGCWLRVCVVRLKLSSF